MGRSTRTGRGTEHERPVCTARLGLELHPEKTRVVDLTDGREGFDFLGCHLHKRMSGPIWARQRRRVYFLHRWPSRRAMQQVRARVREIRTHGLNGGLSLSRSVPPTGAQ